MDDVEHTLFISSKWQKKRDVGTHRIYTAVNIISIMLQSEEKWKAMDNFAKNVLTSKAKVESD